MMTEVDVNEIDVNGRNYCRVHYPQQEAVQEVTRMRIPANEPCTQYEGRRANNGLVSAGDKVQGKYAHRDAHRQQRQ